MAKKQVILTTEEADGLLKYLASRPYSETFQHIAMIYKCVCDVPERTEERNGKENESPSVHKEQRSHRSKSRESATI